MKIKKEKLEKIVLAAMGVVIAVVVLITLFLVPNLKKIGLLRAEIREQEEKIAAAERDIALLSSIRSQMGNLREEMEKYQQDMPQATPDWLLAKLNLLKEKTGINFDKMEPKGYVEQEGPYKLQKVTLELKTDYHRLGRFINEFESSSPFLKITDLEITANPEDINNHLARFTVGAYVIEE